MNLPNTKGYYVYLILCEDDSIYCGWTTNLIKRFEAHKNGKGAKYTKSHKPVDVIYYESCNSKSEACKREYALKRLSHQEKVNICGKTYIDSKNKI